MGFFNVKSFLRESFPTLIFTDIPKHVRDDIWYEPSKQSIENLFFSHSNKIRAKHLPHMPDLIASDIILFS